MKPVAWTNKEQLKHLANPEIPSGVPMAMWNSQVYTGVDIPLIELTTALQELVEAAINLDSVKGRHHSQIAMERLSKAAKAFKEASK